MLLMGTPCQAETLIIQWPHGLAVLIEGWKHVFLCMSALTHLFCFWANGAEDMQKCIITFYTFGRCFYQKLMRLFIHYMEPMALALLQESIKLLCLMFQILMKISKAICKHLFYYG